MTGDLAPAAPRVDRGDGALRQRARERDFWIAVGGVLVVALLHAAVEAAGWPHRAGHGAIVYLPPLLLLAPVAWAGLRYGLEGGVRTGLLAATVTVPNLLLWHPEGFAWVGDLVFLAVVLLLGAVVALPVEREREARRRAAAATARVHRLEQEGMRAYVREVTLAQEAERARVARDLHDGVAQDLVVLVRHLDDAAAADDPALRDAREVASRALREVRRFSRDLRPTILDDLGLAPAVTWLAEDLSTRTGVAAQAHVVGVPRRLDAPVELALFRIAQEALRNVERHAGAATVDLRLSFGEDDVRLDVQDDGTGFRVTTNPDELARDGRLGTLGMRERAQLVGGGLVITSGPEGTLVAATVPR